MANYYYTDENGSKQGLYTEQQLQRLIARGRVTPTTPIETDAGFKGVASQVPGLNFNTSSPFASNTPPTPAQQETYGVSQSVPPAAPNPFAATPHGESATANPFSTSMPTNHAVPQQPYTPTATFPHLPSHGYSPTQPSGTPTTTTVSLVLGIVALLAWCLPIIGAPIAITGIILGIKGLSRERRGMAIAGTVMSGIGLLLSIINAAIGAYLAATGQLF